MITLAIGGVAGGIAGLLFRSGFGVMGNVILGLVGGFIGGWLFRNLGISVGGEWTGPIVRSTAGAMFLMIFVSLGRRMH